MNANERKTIQRAVLTLAGSAAIDPLVSHAYYALDDLLRTGADDPPPTREEAIEQRDRAREELDRAIDTFARLALELDKYHGTVERMERERAELIAQRDRAEAAFKEVSEQGARLVEERDECRKTIERLERERGVSFERILQKIHDAGATDNDWSQIIYGIGWWRGRKAKEAEERHRRIVHDGGPCDCPPACCPHPRPMHVSETAMAHAFCQGCFGSSEFVHPFRPFDVVAWDLQHERDERNRYGKGGE